MTKRLIALAAALALCAPAIAQDEPESPPSPGQIVAQASDEEWVAIDPEDLLVMRLADDADGNWRVVTIQLMPAPFSQGWVENIRTFARAGWYDGISVNRVQDNYVVQWGDPNYDNPEAEGETKPLPEGLHEISEQCYVSHHSDEICRFGDAQTDLDEVANEEMGSSQPPVTLAPPKRLSAWQMNGDAYQATPNFIDGWPVASGFGKAARFETWPVHCYGMVGVGRSYSPDTGSGAELYTVIGHAPRHLDRNIALVGRIIEGMEHLSSLPRGSGALGFYSEEELDKRTPILSVRVGSDLPEMEQPRFEYLATDSTTFERYAEARANRRDPFFIHPAGGADICNIPVPVRPTPNG